MSAPFDDLALDVDRAVAAPPRFAFMAAARSSATLPPACPANREVYCAGPGLR
jgi:hypothetical protein